MGGSATAWGSFFYPSREVVSAFPYISQGQQVSRGVSLSSDPYNDEASRNSRSSFSFGGTFLFPSEGQSDLLVEWGPGAGATDELAVDGDSTVLVRLYWVQGRFYDSLWTPEAGEIVLSMGAISNRATVLVFPFSLITVVLVLCFLQVSDSPAILPVRPFNASASGVT